MKTNNFMALAEESSAVSSISDAEIISHLLNDKEFFFRNRDVISDLVMPHLEAGNTSSFLEYQAKTLRAQNSRLGKQLERLVNHAKENERSSNYLHRLTKGLLDAKSQLEIVEIVKKNLLEDFSVEEASVMLVLDKEMFAQVNELCSNGETFCGVLPTELTKELFQDKQEQIVSSALIPLGVNCQYGVIAIGSSNPNQYQADLGTLFLKRLGEIVTGSLAHSRRAAVVNS